MRACVRACVRRGRGPQVLQSMVRRRLRPAQPRCALLPTRVPSCYASLARLPSPCSDVPPDITAYPLLLFCPATRPQPGTEGFLAVIMPWTDTSVPEITNAAQRPPPHKELVERDAFKATRAPRTE